MNEPNNEMMAKQLRELPLLEPDADLLARLDEISLGKRSPPRALTWHWGLAAVLMIGVAIAVATLPGLNVPTNSVDQAAATDEPNASRVTSELSDLSQLIARSAVLDEVNATLPDRQRVMNVRDAGRITAIEDRVARLDVALASPAVDESARAELLKRRVGLMDDLVGLRAGVPAQQWL
ncbi:MAG: hypothetical protein AAGL69_13910 [Pseudomonadota bacterium]